MVAPATTCTIATAGGSRASVLQHKAFFILPQLNNIVYYPFTLYSASPYSNGKLSNGKVLGAIQNHTKKSNIHSLLVR